jgi:hypothetical protein
MPSTAISIAEDHEGVGVAKGEPYDPHGYRWSSHATCVPITKRRPFRVLETGRARATARDFATAHLWARVGAGAGTARSHAVIPLRSDLPRAGLDAY